MQSNARLPGVSLVAEGVSGTDNLCYVKYSRRTWLSKIIYSNKALLGGPADYFHVGIATLAKAIIIGYQSLIYNASLVDTTSISTITFSVPPSLGYESIEVNPLTGTVILSQNANTTKIYLWLYNTSIFQEVSLPVSGQWTFTCNGTRWVGVSRLTSTTAVFSDDDGQTWQTFSVPSNGYVKPSYGNNIWIFPVVLSSTGYTSSNGVDWNSVPVSNMGPNHNGYTYFLKSQGAFFRGATSSLVSDIRFSHDGVVWSILPMRNSGWASPPVKLSDIGLISKYSFDSSAGYFWAIESGKLLEVPTTVVEFLESAMVGADMVVFMNSGEAIITNGAYSSIYVVKTISYEYSSKVL